MHRRTIAVVFAAFLAACGGHANRDTVVATLADYLQTDTANKGKSMAAGCGILPSLGGRDGIVKLVETNPDRAPFDPTPDIAPSALTAAMDAHHVTTDDIAAYSSNPHDLATLTTDALVKACGG